MGRGAAPLAIGALLGSAALVVSGCGEDRASGEVSRGQAIAEDVGCMACHSTGTDAKIGPAWGGIWGTEVELADGRTVTVDDEYLRRSVVDPDADVVAGYQLSMPRVPLTDDEVDALVAYLRSVSGGGS